MFLYLRFELYLGMKMNKEKIYEELKRIDAEWKDCMKSHVVVDPVGDDYCSKKYRTFRKILVAKLLASGGLSNAR